MRAVLHTLMMCALVLGLHGCALWSSHDDHFVNYQATPRQSAEDISEPMVEDYAPRSGDDRPVLRVYNWNDYFITDREQRDDESIPLAALSPILRDFMEKYDCIIDYVEYESREEMINNVQSLTGHYDVVMTTTESLLELLALDRLEPLSGQVQGIENLDSRLRDIAGTDLRSYFAPYLTGSTALVYRHDLYPDGFSSWGNFFEPADEVRGKLGVLNEPHTMYLFALLYLGADISNVRPEDVDAASEVFGALIADGAVATIDADVEAVNNALRSGKLHAATQWVGNAVELADSDDRFRYIVPQEGAEKWVDSLVVLRDAPQKELALRFVEHLLQAEIHGAMAAWLASAATSPAARRVVAEQAPEQLQDTRIYSDAYTRDRLWPVDLWDPRIPERWRVLVETQRER